MKNILIILLISLAVTAGPVLRCVSNTGGFVNGSGWDGATTFRSAPVLCDDGMVYFVAPMRSSETPFAASDLLHAVYAGNPFASTPNYRIVFSGYNEFFYAITGMIDATAHKRIAVDATREHIVATVRDIPPFGSQSEFVVDNTGESVMVGDEDYPTDACLSMSGDGGVVCVGNLESSYKFLDSNLKGMPLLLTGDGTTVAFSRNAANVYFAAPDEDGVMALWDYDIANESCEFINIIQDTAHGMLANGAEISSASGCDAFAFVTNRSSLLDDSGDDYVSHFGAQIVLARRDSDGEWLFSWCDSGTHLYKCSSPSVSADGRYVAFIASSSANGTMQAYRFDSKNGTMELASVTDKPADAACAATAISPNGRYVGFVTTAKNLGYSNSSRKANVWVADFGPRLDVDGTIYVCGTELSGCPVKLEGAGVKTRLSVSWEGELPGELQWNGDRRIESGMSFPADGGQLYGRWSQDGQCALHFVLSDGELVKEYDCAAVFQEHSYPKASHVSYLVEDGVHVFANAGGYSLSGGSFAMNEDASVVAFTSVAKSQNETYGSTAIYVRKLKYDRVKIIEDSGVSGAIKLSGDGSWLFYVTVDGVRRYSVKDGSRELFLPGGEDIAVSHDAKAYAYVKDGLPYFMDQRLSEVGTFSAPEISRDGAVASFLKGDELFVWKCGEFRKIADGVARAFMGLSGSRMLMLQNGALKWSDSGEELDVPFDLSSVKALAMSSNSRFLSYCRTDGRQQAFRYDMLTGEETPFSVLQSGTYADAAVNSLLAISASGAKIMFATSARNLVTGKKSFTSNELYLAEYSRDVNNSASIDGTLDTTEGADVRVLELDYSDSENNDAVPELLDVPNGLEMELLPPDWEHAWYSLSLRTLDAHCCGVFTIRIRVWDGIAWSEPQELTLDIKNVNDAPFWKEGATCSYEVAEGEVLSSIDYKAFADDYDLENPEPYSDELTFELEGAPDWVTIDGAVFEMRPGYDVSEREVEREFEFSVVVKDKAGEFAKLPINVVVRNTNRSPVIGVEEISLRECDMLAWNAFSASDPDAEDTLRIRLSSAYGRWIDKDGNAVSGDIPQERFPLMYVANPNVVESAVETVRTVDDDGALSAEAKISISSNQIRLNSKDIWPDVISGHAKGWLLLSTPVAVSTEELHALLGAEAIFVWDGKAFVEATDEIEGGRGFFAYALGSAKATSFLGKRYQLFETGWGWNLVGNAFGEEGEQGGYVLEKHSYRHVETSADGKGYWIFKQYDK